MAEPYYSDEFVTLYLGDSMEVEEWLYADSMVTDPPYGLGYSAHSGHPNKGWTSRWTGHVIKGDDTTDIRDCVLEKWGFDRPALVFGSWKRQAPPCVREVLVWDKKISLGMGALDIPWRPSWEAIYVIGKGFVGNRTHGVLCYGLATRAPERKMHPNAKPVALLQELVAKCPGVIADPFAGSGSTLVAARLLGRRSIGVEVDEEFCETAAKRLAGCHGHEQEKLFD